MGGETISVVVPVYNSEKYLRACLESLKHQTYPDLEIWLVDDGSVDESGRICDEYKASDSRFHVIHQKNAGASAARNAGIRMAAGTYISFIDSDDWVEPAFFEKLISLFDRDIVMGMCCYCLSDGKPCLPMGVDREAEYETDDALCLIITDKMSGPCNKLFLLSRIRERELFFDPKVTVGEDMLFVFEYLKGGKMRYIPQALYHYRQTEDSVSRSDFKPSRMTIFDALDRMRDETPEKSGTVHKAIRSKRAYTGFVSLLILMTSRNKPEREKEIRKSLVQTIRKNLGDFLKAAGYSMMEKMAVILVAASPGLGTAAYRMTYMKKIRNR